MATDFKRWDEYQAEAEVEPFRLVVSDEETLVFEVPTGTALIRIQEGQRKGDTEMIMRYLAGSNYDRMRELVNVAGWKAMRDVVEDMLAHFELFEPVPMAGPAEGQYKLAKTAREVNKLIRLGWRASGEAYSRT